MNAIPVALVMMIAAGLAVMLAYLVAQDTEDD